MVLSDRFDKPMSRLVAMPVGTTFLLNIWPVRIDVRIDYEVCFDAPATVRSRRPHEPTRIAISYIMEAEVLVRLTHNQYEWGDLLP
jgi:hypothetical protein